MGENIRFVLDARTPLGCSQGGDGLLRSKSSWFGELIIRIRRTRDFCHRRKNHPPVSNAPDAVQHPAAKDVTMFDLEEIDLSAAHGTSRLLKKSFCELVGV